MINTLQGIDLSTYALPATNPLVELDLVPSLLPAILDSYLYRLSTTQDPLIGLLNHGWLKGRLNKSRPMSYELSSLTPRNHGRMPTLVSRRHLIGRTPEGTPDISP